MSAKNICSFYVEEIETKLELGCRRYMGIFIINLLSIMLGCNKRWNSYMLEHAKIKLSEGY